MKKLRAFCSALVCFAALAIPPGGTTTAVAAMAISRGEMEGKINSYIAAERAGDYATMAGLLGVSEEEVRQAINQHLDFLRVYLRERLNLQLKEVRFGQHQTLFVRESKNEAFVGQEVYIYLVDAGKLRRQHEYSLFRVTFDERGYMRWQILGSSRGDFEDVGQES